MADKKKNKPVKEEKKIPVIPVFAVLKNGSILKNIFLLDSPPSISEQPKSIESSENSQKCSEEILIVGRHPDCNIMVEHPSISRFHLRICSKPSLQKLSVMDLSSAHGTWVSGQKIEPEVPVELNEGDALRLGASTRIYRLHWMPLSQAFDVENRFVPPSAALQHEEEEEEEEKANQDENSTPVIKGIPPSAPPYPETSKFSFLEENSIRNSFVSASDALPQEDEEEEEEETYQNENSISQSASPTPETMNSSFPEENSVALAHMQIPSAPPMPESMNSSSPDDGEGMEEEEVMSAGERLQEVENQSPPRRIIDKSSLWSETVATESVKPSFPVDDILSEIIALQLDKEDQSPQVLCSTQVLSTIKNQETPFTKSVGAGISAATESLNPSMRVDGVFSELTSLQLDIENQSPQGLCSTEVFSERESQDTPLRRSESKCNAPNLWSRRGKPASVLQIQTGKRRGKNVGAGISGRIETENQKGGKGNPISRVIFPSLNGGEEIFTPDKDNLSPNTRLLKSMKSSGKNVGAGISDRTETENRKGGKENPISSVIFPRLNGEEEIFTPDKENFSPNTQLLKSLKVNSSVKSMKKVKVDEIMHSKLCRSRVDPEEELFSSDKENQTPKILKERKPDGTVSQTRGRLDSQTRGMLGTGIMETKRGLERVPFQSLLSNSSSKSRSEVSGNNATTKSSHSVNCSQATQENIDPSPIPFHKESKKWNMVVDTTSLLNKESRKSLKLLQGLKGTQLIIPRMVIRELDCLKRRGSLFRRESDVSSVLKWIEDCMLKTKWWIRVQNSVEETRPIAPTPPASPGISEVTNFGFAGGSTSSVPFSSFGSLTEIVSPTAEDHILECALLFKRIMINEHLILLTNDVTLKIKAMAEGLLCETAEEFRASLVNPYSKRFLWAESTPRGPTWSGVDDIVLRENYYNHPIKKSTPRGLKLILLHNSQYGQINSIN